MPSSEDGPVIRKVWDEQSQHHNTRSKIITEIDQILGRPIVVYYTSFNYPVSIEDSDADMLEGLLQKMDLSKGLALVINSPGGYGTAAERIINVCKSYSGTGEFWAIVTNRAKSAATMICLGASKIFMAPTSELGPIDPIFVCTKDDGSRMRVSLYNLVKNYEKIFGEAVKTTGHLEPYLQQLAHYDSREMKEFEHAVALAEDIAINSLQSCMMKGSQREDIKKRIGIFLTPETKLTHERAIYLPEASKCGLKIETLIPKQRLWELLYELHIRTNNIVNTNVSVIIESSQYSFARPPPQTKSGENE
jgi:ATP-dependent protease ClpP protease subunit